MGEEMEPSRGREGREDAPTRTGCSVEPAIREFVNPYGTVENLWKQLKRTENLMDEAMTDRMFLAFDMAQIRGAKTLKQAKEIAEKALQARSAPEQGEGKA